MKSLASIYVLVVLGAAGCDPNPSAEQARSYLSQHRQTIDAVRGDVRSRIEARPGILATPCSALDPECEGPSIEERLAEIRALREESLDVFDDAHVLGLEVILEGERGPLVDIGLTPGGHAHGRVAAESGEEVDAVMLGRGAYQTSFSSAAVSAGDGEHREGIEVRWQDEIASRGITGTLYLLGDDTTTGQWRDAIRQRSAAD